MNTQFQEIYDSLQKAANYYLENNIAMTEEEAATLEIFLKGNLEVLNNC